VTGGIEPYTFSWNFGDGSSSSSSKESGNDETIRHTFDQAGTYNVDVTVTDSTGRTASDSMLITVEVPPRPLPPPPPPPLTAVEITSSDTQDVAPATFRFEAHVTGGTEPYTYSWNFGDGSSQLGNEQTVMHTFDQAGTYTVRVTVTDSTGRTAFNNIEINVKEVPVVIGQPLNLDNLDNLLDNLFGRLGLR
jgi:PKD repeat protein